MTDFHGSACDFCETKFVAKPGERIDYGEFFDAGWFELNVEWSEARESTVSLDFCSLRCLVGWALVEKVGPEELAGILAEEE